MTTREEAIQAAGRVVAEAELDLRRGTVVEVAARSYGVVSGRYTQAEMEAIVQAIRDGDVKRPARPSQLPAVPAGGTPTTKPKSA